MKFISMLLVACRSARLRVVQVRAITPSKIDLEQPLNILPQLDTSQIDS